MIEVAASTKEISNGSKVNPIGLRLGINRNWDSRWFPKFETMPANVAEDDKIRKFVKRVILCWNCSNCYQKELLKS